MSFSDRYGIPMLVEYFLDMCLILILSILFLTIKTKKRNNLDALQIDLKCLTNTSKNEGKGSCFFFHVNLSNCQWLILESMMLVLEYAI